MKVKLLLSSLLCASLTMTACDKIQDTSTAQTEEVTANQQSTDTSPEPTTSNLPDDAPSYQVGTLASFEPFCFMNEFGNSTGFDIELIRAVGEKAGFRVNFEVTPWDKMLSSLEEDSFDIVASSVVITPERKEKYDISDSYIHSSLSLLMTEQNAGKSFDEVVSNPNTKYALLSGSTPLRVMRTELNIPDKNITQVETQFFAIREVINGSADATFEDSNMLKYSSKEFDGLTIIGTEKYPLDLGFVVRKGNTELLDKINLGLAEVKKDGTYDKIYEKWFGPLTDSQ